MKNVCISVVLVALGIQGVYADNFVKPEAKLGDAMTVPGAIDLPAWFKNSFLDLREDIRDAASAKKRLMLYFYQDGCPYCKKLIQTNFAIKALEDKAKNNLDVIAINMWGDREVVDVDGTTLTEKAFAAKLRVMFTPTLIFFDDQSHQLLRINGYYEPKRFETVLDFVAGGYETGVSYRDFAARRMLASDHSTSGLRKESYFAKDSSNLSALSAGKKPMVILFEQQDCPPCVELHADVLPRAETQALLKHFVVTQLDMWSGNTITLMDKTKTTVRDWAKSLDIKYAPTMVFFDENGKEVFRDEAYLKSFHVQSTLDYVASGEYKREPSFQRFIEARADGLRKQGVKVDLMN